MSDASGIGSMSDRRESGFDRLDGTLFVLMILSRIVDRRRRRRYAPSLTRSSTRTIQHPSDQSRNLLGANIDLRHDMAAAALLG
jgi:hypothetical protein